MRLSAIDVTSCCFLGVCGVARTSSGAEPAVSFSDFFACVVFLFGDFLVFFVMPFSLLAFVFLLLVPALLLSFVIDFNNSAGF